jgi:acyl-CoA synthetase (AMP-forming)/AMP-acid ligase II/acyl carrier protein
MVDALQDRASSDLAGCLAYRWLVDGERSDCEWTFAELDRRARRIASFLLEKKLTGHRILLVYSPGPEFLEAFWGCLYAGAVAVPTSPPNLSTRSRVAHRFLRIMKDAQCSLGLTTGDLLGQLIWLLSRESVTDTRPFVDTTLLPYSQVESGSLPTINPASLAMLQYTSGSTQTPRGVMLTHCNLMANHEAIRASTAHDQSSVMVTWLPPYHDMGLIAGLLQPTVVGFPTVQMAPNDFLRKPIRWLQAVSQFGATTSGGPDFAYGHCLEYITDDELAGLDLSCWENAFNGSEVIRAETIDSFTSRFQQCGFRRTMFFPCYGLAEATLMAASTITGGGPKTISLSRSALLTGRAVTTSANNDPTEIRQVISCGTAPAGHSLAIVNPKTDAPCEDGQIGEIRVSGPSISPGYWQHPKISEETFRRSDSGEKWLATGDYGCLINGELIVTGRLKELIIIRGRNVIPQDLECTSWNAHRAVEPNAAAAFSADVNGTECAVVAVELRRTERRDADPQEIVSAINRAISEEHGIALHEVVLLRPGSIPRTTSGKIQRLLCQRLYQDNNWKVIARVACSDVVKIRNDLQFSDNDRSLLRQYLLGTDIDAVASASGTGSDQSEVISVRYAHLLSERISRLTGVPVKDIRVDDSLSVNGLDSLQRIELVLQVEAEFGIPSGSLPAGECTTLEMLAAELAQRRHSNMKTATQQNKLTRKHFAKSNSPAKNEPIPLTTSQARFLMTEPANLGCFPVIIYARLPQGVDADRMQAALCQLATNQDVFRMRFQRDEGEWSQRDLGSPINSISLEWIDASQLPEKELRHSVQATLQRIRSGFDISAGPLAHTAVFWHGSQDAPTLILGMHHLLTDAVSISVCAAELSRTLDSADSTDRQHPREPQSPFASYALSNQNLLNGPVWDHEVEYWLRQIGPSTTTGVDATASIEKPAVVRAVITGRLPDEASRQLLSRLPLSRQQHDAFVSALATAWTSLTDEHDVVIELENHGRDSSTTDRNLHGIAGWLSTRFPVRLERSKTVPQMVLQATQDILKAVPGAGVNYGILRYSTAQHRGKDQLERLRSPVIAFFSRNTTAGIGRNDLAVRILHVDVWHDYGFFGPEITMYGGIDGNLIRWDLVYIESMVSRPFVLQLSEMIERFLIVLAQSKVG